MRTLKIRQRAGLILATVTTVLLVSGCGGGELPIDIEQEAELHAVQYSAGGAGQPATAHSFTVKPADEFNGFNPELWNGRKAWADCDCGRQPRQQQPKIATWNPI